MIARTLRLSLGLICLVLSVTVGHADNGVDPLRALRKAAEENDPEAQYSLAIEIFKLPADQGAAGRGDRLASCRGR